MRNVNALRNDPNNEDLTDIEKQFIQDRGWTNANYNPFIKPLERIRFGMVFGDDNIELQKKIDLLNSLI
jgi:hypothetical protein